MTTYENPDSITQALLDETAPLGIALALQQKFTERAIGTHLIERGDILDAALLFDGDAIIADQEASLEIGETALSGGLE